MQAKRIDHGGARRFAVVFESGDRVMEGLLRFARDHDIRGASFTAIGGFEEATLGFFDPAGKHYEEIQIDEQVEVLALTGNIGVHGDGTQAHAHVVLGMRDGSARGGHLLAATVRPTLEVVVEETPSALTRRIDDDTGLPLIDMDAATGPVPSAAPGKRRRPA